MKLILQINSQPNFINATNSEGRSVCEAALEGRSYQVLKALVEKRAALPRNSLTTAVKKTTPIELLEYIVFLRASVNEIDEKGLSPLIKAVYERNMEAMESLLQFGADINHQRKEGSGNTALITAIKTWCPDTSKIVELLIKRGSNVGLVNKQGQNALMAAASLAWEITDSDYHHFQSTTASYASFIKSVREIVVMLLDAGIGAGGCDASGRYALDLACQVQHWPSSYKQLVKLLFVAGASASQQVPRALNVLSVGEVPPLQHVCRDVIRDQLMLNNIDSNLFKIVPKLPLPAPILSFLLYGVDLG